MTSLALPWLGDAGPVTIWVVVLVFIFLECAFILGLFLPGDSLLFAAGVLLAAHGHESGAWLLGGVATVVAVAGNQVGYLFGRYTGTRMLARKEGRVLNRANLCPGDGVLRALGLLGDRRGAVDPLGPHARADDRRRRADGQPALHHGERGGRGVLGADADPARLLRGGPARRGAVAQDGRGGGGGGGLRHRQRRRPVPLPAGDAPPDRRGRPAPRRRLPRRGRRPPTAGGNSPERSRRMHRKRTRTLETRSAADDA